MENGKQLLRGMVLETFCMCEMVDSPTLDRTAPGAASKDQMVQTDPF